MKGRQIVLGAWRGGPAAAVVVDGRLHDLLTDPGTDLAPGAIFRGKVDRVVKGGAFVTLPGKQGYLRGGGALKPGRAVLAQVSSFSEGTKAVPLTGRLVFKGRTVIVTPGAEGINVSRQVRNEDERLRLFSAVDTYAAATSPHGIVVRTAAVQATDKDIAEETDALLAEADAVLAEGQGEPSLLRPAADAHAAARREWMTDEDAVIARSNAFDELGLCDDIESLRSPDVSLGRGALTIEPTHALVAVDVNTGADFSPSAGLKINIAAARELPRQLRLRGPGGQIIVDFAPMPKKDRRVLEETLKAAFRKDPVETSLVGWTTLSLFELQRKRERHPLIFSDE